jgi:sugar porter (SP) family MFS transporter
MDDPKSVDAVYVDVKTPKAAPNGGDATMNASHAVKLTSGFWLTFLVPLLQPFQYGWSTSQLNLNTFNNEEECNARPVVDGTCIMFPGHQKASWTLAVNMWVIGKFSLVFSLMLNAAVAHVLFPVGGMFGSLYCGPLAQRLGRKKVFFINAIVMFIGTVIQTTSFDIAQFIVGRFVSGLASGVATGLVGSYISEISPPHLQSVLHLGLQISFTFGLLMVVVFFFFCDTVAGWRIIAGFPVINSVLFMLLAPFFMLESPVWLLAQGRRAEATKVISRLYGPDGVQHALQWLEKPATQSTDSMSTEPEQEDETLNVWGLITSSKYRKPLVIAIGVACAQQITGIDAIFFYSATIFARGGISDGRIGSVIDNLLMLLPSFLLIPLTQRFGNRKMMIGSACGMCMSALALTIAYICDVPTLSVVFTATFTLSFALGCGPLIWGVTSDLFPPSQRPTGVSICIAINWICNLLVGVVFPYMNDGLDDYSFVPFVVVALLYVGFFTYCMPETMGKTSAEIQAWMRGEKKEEDRQ